MASNYTTRAGLTPSENELPYSITTSDVKGYLQKKLNAVVNGMRKNGQYNGENIEVDIITVEMGNNFVPFTVVLPTTVLKQYNKPRRNNELSIFNPKDNDQTVNIMDPIIRMFGSYTFDKADGEAFFSADWRRARGVSTTTSAILKTNRTPRLTRLANGSLERVTFLIDPIRVFHDMLTVDGNNTNFKVDIKNWQKIRSGEFRYDVMRVISKKKGKKGGHNFADELNRQMRGHVR